MFHMRIMLLTYNFHMIYKLRPSQNFEVVSSTLFLFTVLLNISLPTPRILRLPLISWQNTFKTSKLTVEKLMTLTI